MEIKMINRDMRYSAYIGVLIGLLVGLMLMLSGCGRTINPTHSYYVQRCEMVNSVLVCTEMKVESKLEFEEIEIGYNKVAGSFDFRASNVSATESALETMAAELIPELIEKGVP